MRSNPNQIVAAPIVLITTLSLTFSGSASAGLDGAKLFKNKSCHVCHGKDANTPLISSYPSIAGQNKRYLVQQMEDIKVGIRSNSNSKAMKRIMSLVSEEEIKSIATYVSTLDYKPKMTSAKRKKLFLFFQPLLSKLLQQKVKIHAMLSKKK